MRICDICFEIIEEGDICAECLTRKPAGVWMKEYGMADEEVIKRTLELMNKKEENIEKINCKLKKESKSYRVI